MNAASPGVARDVEARCIATKPRLDPTLPDKQCPRRAKYGEWCRQHAESLGGWRLTSPGNAIARLGLSAEQTAILQTHLASRQQTVAEFLGDVLMEYGLGRATGKDYPPPAAALAPDKETPDERR